MNIDHIDVYPVTLPFSVDFSHALRKRSSAGNVIVAVAAREDGPIGYGEAAPRSYVTGETQEGVIESLQHLISRNEFPWELKQVSQIWGFIDGLSGGKKQNAAVCALETALLDALGRSRNKHIIDYFTKDFFTDTVYYGAPIPLAGRKRVLELCRLIKTMAIHKLRLKWGKDLEQNKEIIETVHAEFGGNCDLRVDVNCVWDRGLALEHLPLIHKYNIKAVEQPMVPENPDLADFAPLLKDAGVHLMADESACTLKEVKRITGEGHYNMINVRLSKCGGFRNSLRIIAYLRKNRVPFQIGCQLGESGILSAAGRVLGLLCRDAEYFDGSYDEFLLRENTTFENVSFGLHGKAGLLEGSGLGVRVNPEQCDLLRNGAKIITVSNPHSSRR